MLGNYLLFCAWIFLLFIKALLRHRSTCCKRKCTAKSGCENTFTYQRLALLRNTKNALLKRFSEKNLIQYVFILHLKTVFKCRSRYALSLKKGKKFHIQFNSLLRHRSTCCKRKCSAKSGCENTFIYQRLALLRYQKCTSESIFRKHIIQCVFILHLKTVFKCRSRYALSLKKGKKFHIQFN